MNRFLQSMRNISCLPIDCETNKDFQKTLMSFISLTKCIKHESNSKVVGG